MYNANNRDNKIVRSLFAEGEIFMSDTIYLAKADARSLDLICMYIVPSDPWKYSILFLTMLMKAGKYCCVQQGHEGMDHSCFCNLALAAGG